jgi:uncharacterized membrane protein YedE/YeeE
MTPFTPIASTLGGLLIGAAAVLLWVGLGRIAGISGIVGGLPAASASDRPWRIAFLAGLIAAPVLYGLAGGSVPQPAVAASPIVVVIAGLLVGFGTTLGGGCTSGHGVCGLARLSPRSIAATLLFLATAMVTVFVVRHIWGA